MSNPFEIAGIYLGICWSLKASFSGGLYYIEQLWLQNFIPSVVDDFRRHEYFIFK